ncbi:hypothetical protein, partial [Xenorhabdus sp. KK7.4]|uniref:hypothetical protein n=1 Tax=Xenorhabdus sp. KK7.4 TaxID=1851572 RepID=UPI0019D4558C
ARCFNKSKGVFIAASSLKALRNPLPSRGFSIYNKKGHRKVAFFFDTNHIPNIILISIPNILAAKLAAVIFSSCALIDKKQSKFISD